MRSTAILRLSSLLLISPIVSAQWSFPDEIRCTMPNQQLGTCINIRRCPSMLDMLQTRPLTPQITDFLRKSQCGYEGSNPKVCCKYNDIVEAPTEAPIQNPLTNPEPPPNVRNHPNLRLLEAHCGIINKPKIIGGTVTGINEFPWMALLSYDVGRTTPEFRCGGSVINKRYILTAAHCVTKLPSNLRLIGVRVGEHDMGTDVDCENMGSQTVCNGEHQDFGIEEVIFHPQYARTALHNDVALIRVNDDIDFRPANAKAICMPLNIAGVIPPKMTVTGWGVTELQVSSPVMLKVNLPRFSQDECAAVYQRQTEIWHKQMCMGGQQGKDSCNGDSGGPIQAPGVVNGKNKYIQYGIVSFGVKNCGTQGLPGVYTRVDYYLDWILNSIRA
ncbi:melanization protease 1-like [Phymastichus coffea]|uniref:melanization protease 1-like n=1 Tax=Phymastichus coffea TaxID=108790 RepID=UPI00273BB2DF|nr:melanization protease 1-like [Phymastichus coffea]